MPHEALDWWLGDPPELPDLPELPDPPELPLELFLEWPPESWNGELLPDPLPLPPLPPLPPPQP